MSTEEIFRGTNSKTALSEHNQGYICGYLSGFDINEGNVVLKIHGFEIKNHDVNR